MLSFVILLAMFVVLCVIFFQPKIGSYLIWFILFAYPHSWWYHNNFLPWNIGADDLFCLILFLVVLVRRNIFGGVSIRFGCAFILITSFTLISIVASISGYSYAQDFYLFLYLKEIFKYGIHWALFYAILHCIDDEKDLRMQVYMFSLASLVGGIIVILHYFLPYAFSIFTEPTDAERVIVEGRATGAFLNANNASCMLIYSMIILISVIKLLQIRIIKAIAYACVVIFIIGIMITKSRAGLLAFSGVIISMAIFSKTKRITWLTIVCGLFVVLLASDLRETYLVRIQTIYTPTGQFGGGVVGRVEMWKRYFESATPQIYIFGQGPVQGHSRNGGSPHNAYISLLTVYGIPSVIWGICSVFVLMSKIARLKKSAFPSLTIIATGCFWSLVAWSIFALSADAISSFYTKYLLFYSFILIDRASHLDQTSQGLLYDSEESLYT